MPLTLTFMDATARVTESIAIVDFVMFGGSCQHRSLRLGAADRLNINIAVAAVDISLAYSQSVLPRDRSMIFTILPHDSMVPNHVAAFRWGPSCENKKSRSK